MNIHVQLYIDFKQKSHCMYYLDIFWIWKVKKLYALFHGLLCPFVEETMLKNCTKLYKPLFQCRSKSCLRTTHTIALRWPNLWWYHLSEDYVDFSDNYVILPGVFIDLSLIYMFKSSTQKRVHDQIEMCAFHLTSCFCDKST